MTNAKKFLIFIVAIVVIGMTIFLLSRFFAPAGGEPVGISDQTLTGSVKVKSTLPQDDTLSIGTARGSVTVKNFYASALGFNEQFVILARENSYEINYDTYTSGFSVYVSAAPFDVNRGAAEKKLLDTLGVSQADICKLKIFETVSKDVDKNSAGRNLGLSFCMGIL